MSLFGEVQTPQAERPGPPVKQLTELTLRVYGARLEPEQNVVRLHAEAKTAFADGTTGAGVSVGFFLHGNWARQLGTLHVDFPVVEFSCRLQRVR